MTSKFAGAGYFCECLGVDSVENIAPKASLFLLRA